MLVRLGLHAALWHRSANVCVRGSMASLTCRVCHPLHMTGGSLSKTDHHYEPALGDINNCVTYFPGAAIVGDDWDYPDVRRAAKEVAARNGLRIHAEQNKCWTYSAILSTKNHSEPAPSASVSTSAPTGTCMFESVCVRFCVFPSQGLSSTWRGALGVVRVPLSLCRP
jgi:hypothetical protein